MLFSSVKNNLEELKKLASQLTSEAYSKPSLELSGASIGAHYRHIIEIYLCLLNNYQTGTVNYDCRKRDMELQSNPKIAAEKLTLIQTIFEREDKPLLLEQTLKDEKITFQTNYFRELLYNLEHSIHHQALIKVALQSSTNIEVDENFGVASATIAYRKKCVS